MKFKDVKPGIMILQNESLYVVIGSINLSDVTDEFNDYVVYYINSFSEIDFYTGNSNEEFLYLHEKIVNE